MRHRNLRTKPRGDSSAARAMWSNMIRGLLEHGRIKTTERRAKIARSMVEKLVTRATRLGDLLLKDRTKLGAEDQARVIHAIRMVRRDLKDPTIVLRLFDEWAPRYLGRPGGYTRIYKLGARKGDAAPMAILEFIEAEMPEREGAPKASPAAPEKKQGRLSRLLGRKKDEDKKKK